MKQQCDNCGRVLDVYDRCRTGVGFGYRSKGSVGHAIWNTLLIMEVVVHVKNKILNIIPR